MPCRLFQSPVLLLLNAICRLPLSSQAQASALSSLTGEKAKRAVLMMGGFLSSLALSPPPKCKRACLHQPPLPPPPPRVSDAVFLLLTRYDRSPKRVLPQHPAVAGVCSGIPSSRCLDESSILTFITDTLTLHCKSQAALQLSSSPLWRRPWVLGEFKIGRS